MNTIIDYFMFNLSLKNRKIHFIAKKISEQKSFPCVTVAQVSLRYFVAGTLVHRKERHKQRWCLNSPSPSSCACKTLQEITGNQGSPVNPTHVWMGDHVKLLKQAIIQDFKSRAKFGTLSWQGRDLSWSSVTMQEHHQLQSHRATTPQPDTEQL